VTRHGFLGGTFDPVHVGHLDVARAARNALALDDVSFMPSNVPPHRGQPQAPAADRLAMVQLAVAGNAGLVASNLELEVTGPSYTSGTLDRLEERGVDLRTVFFITGADAFRDITMWKDYPQLLDRCHFVAVSRPSCPASTLRTTLPALATRMLDTPAAIPAKPAIFLVDAPTAPVSSTTIRHHLGEGRSIEGLVPPPVAAYIHSHGLYGAGRSMKGPDA
jgi:nicotinate-nucleotide adenylyltransferase